MVWILCIFLHLFFLLFAGFHDLRVSLGKSDSNFGYLLTYIIVLFVFIQTALIMYKWIKAFNEKEKLAE